MTSLHSKFGEARGWVQWVFRQTRQYCTCIGPPLIRQLQLLYIIIGLICYRLQTKNQMIIYHIRSHTSRTMHRYSCSVLHDQMMLASTRSKQPSYPRLLEYQVLYNTLSLANDLICLAPIFILFFQHPKNYKPIFKTFKPRNTKWLKRIM